jgi:hypothetical protein
MKRECDNTDKLRRVGLTKSERESKREKEREREREQISSGT